MYLSTIICKFNVNWTWWFDLLLRTIHLYSDCNTWPPTYSLNKYLVFKNFNILSFALKTEIKEKEKEYEKTTSALKLFTDRLLHWNFIVHKQKVFVFCKFLPKLWENRILLSETYHLRSTLKFLLPLQRRRIPITIMLQPNPIIPTISIITPSNQYLAFSRK